MDWKLFRQREKAVIEAQAAYTDAHRRAGEVGIRGAELRRRQAEADASEARLADAYAALREVSQ